MVSIFEKCIRGERQKSADRIAGNVPYYSASDTNNGMTDMIGNPTFIEENALICTTFGDCFWVDGKFTASDEITIMKHSKLNRNIGLFIATMINKNKSKYSFKNKAFFHKLQNDNIFLPVNQVGEPDFEYMENYIESIYSKLSQRI